jgi:hypothetical protein
MVKFPKETFPDKDVIKFTSAESCPQYRQVSEEEAEAYTRRCGKEKALKNLLSALSSVAPEHVLPDLVTLDQAAAGAKRSKRTLERYKTKGKLPAPVVEGGAGKPDLYDWPTMRNWIESEFGVPNLPEVFPANRRHP